MWIVVDTNIFFHDLRISRSLDLLFKEIENIHFSLRIPEVVVHETINIYKEHRQSNRSNLNKSIREWNYLALKSKDLPLVEQETIENDLHAYEEYLRSKILSCGEVIPYPEIPHQILAERAISKKKPFSGKGKGYRDALIWETIQELACQEDCEAIAFITENSTDFADKHKSQLHPDLISDLKRIGIAPAKVILFTSLDEFIDTKVIPVLDDLHGIQEVISSGNHISIDLYGIADPYIWELVVGYEIDYSCLPDFWEDNIEVSIYHADSDYIPLKDELDVKRLSKSELLITASYELFCVVDVFVPKWETGTYEFKEMGFFVDEYDWNETYARCGIYLPFKIVMRFVFNEDEDTVTMADIVSAECLNNLT